MELIDERFYEELLRVIGDKYPNNAQWHDLDGMAEQNVLNVNLHYLAEHDLIDMKQTTYLDGAVFLEYARITAKGIDFLSGGGLSAKLNTVTVRFDEATLKAILMARVEASDVSPTEKTAIKKHLSDLSAHSVKHLVTKLLDVGLAQLPNAGHVIAEALTNLAS